MLSSEAVLILNIAPKIFNRHVDDSHARFRNKAQPMKFLDLLNSPDTPVQFTVKFENACKQFP